MGWTGPFWAEVADDTFGMVRFSPTYEFEASGELAAEIHLAFADFIFRLVLEAYNFTPFDFLMWVDPYNPKRYCVGFEYYTTGLRAYVNLEQHIDECYLGGFGFLNEDRLDCYWRTYKPELAVYEIQASDFVDVRGDYIRFKCMNWFSADWDNWDSSKNGP